MTDYSTSDTNSNDVLVGSYTARRFFVWNGAPPVAAAPSAGGAVHGVSCSAQQYQIPDISPATRNVCLACTGRPFVVETGGAFSAGVALKTDANGKAVAQGGSGVIVAMALEAAGAAGEFRWAVFV